MELLDFEEEKENNAPIDIDDDDDNSDNTDLFCRRMMKITICAQVVLRILLPTLSNNADI